MPLLFKQFAATVASSLRALNCPPLRTRGGGGHEDRPKGFAFSRGVSRKWEYWELPCYVISGLLPIVLGVVLIANPHLSIEAETWSHQKALQWLEKEKTARHKAIERIEAANSN